MNAIKIFLFPHSNASLVRIEKGKLSKKKKIINSVQNRKKDKHNETNEIIYKQLRLLDGLPDMYCSCP